MLVQNSFYFISLPRSASTAFMASCIKYELDIRHVVEWFDPDNQLGKNTASELDTDFGNFQHVFQHPHESIWHLQQKFGSGYPIISIRRDPYERFISLWKHILHQIDLYVNSDTYEKCLKLNVNDILFYTNRDLFSDTDSIVNEFVERYELNQITDYGKQILRILVSPCSQWHNHDPKIIWFDFRELHKLESWVSDKLNIDFKLLKINSSKHYDCPLILNDEFKEKYDSVYKRYDEIKSIKTLI